MDGQTDKELQQLSWACSQKGWGGWAGGSPVGLVGRGLAALDGAGGLAWVFPGVKVRP